MNVNLITVDGYFMTAYNKYIVFSGYGTRVLSESNNDRVLHASISEQAAI